MNKIGILLGQEKSFPPAFVERVNSNNVASIIAEFVTIEKVIQGESMVYVVIIYRISQDVLF